MDIPVWGWWAGAFATVGTVWGFAKDVLEIRTKLAGTRFGKRVVMFATEGKRIRILEEKVAALTPEVIHPDLAAWRESIVKVRDYRAECSRLLDLAPSRTQEEVGMWFDTAVVLSAAVAALMADPALPLIVQTRYRQPQARPSRPVPESLSKSKHDALTFTREFQKLDRIGVALAEVEPVLARAIEQRTPAKNT